MTIFRLSKAVVFPQPHLADANGLLAVGGDLSPERLLQAYQLGIFPWFLEDEPYLWWSPDPRLVLYPDELIISKSLKKIIKQNTFQITMDCAFDQVIQSCAHTRLNKNEDTWIDQEMVDAYCELHQSGYAHSVEAWSKGKLEGGLYGVALGKCFFGESMFSNKSNASKVAFVYLVKYLRKRSYMMVDCQVTTAHLQRFGAKEIPRESFLKQLEQAMKSPTDNTSWK
jgi:leucyl/phenylalanyl-tRNA--protein transferase